MTYPFADRKRKIEILVTQWAEETGLYDDDTYVFSTVSETY